MLEKFRTLFVAEIQEKNLLPDLRRADILNPAHPPLV